MAEAIAAARDEPLVIAPGSVKDPGLIAESDTDLHLERQALGQARTLRADEVAALAAAEQQAAASAPAVVRTVRSPEVTMRPAPAAPRGELPVVIDDSPTAVTGELPSRQGYVWAVVAIVAALVGVAIGVIVGMR
jgi:hypothetical protein